MISKDEIRIGMDVVPIAKTIGRPTGLELLLAAYPIDRTVRWINTYHSAPVWKIEENGVRLKSPDDGAEQCGWRFAFEDLMPYIPQTKRESL